ncbi:hypothetical protein F442_19598 [Phytophthora nicotianae P10297]|uniref:Uncharacterized protein n=1 Tax=Phytophthora nicotianae P10297 TaxID=1317064 RepID=W2Y907_PHYNI|nr:hypothetical protein F442_19598 [Phytophthora nicotianae P10297]
MYPLHFFEVEAVVAALRSFSDKRIFMWKSELLSVVRSLLPPGTVWPNEHGDAVLEGGKTVLMLVARVSDPHLAVKLIDFVCPHTANFWARDHQRRHAIMDVCHLGGHPSVLLRLIKWAKKTSVRVIVPMSRQDIDGLDAVELAIRGGHGQLASCLLEQHGPNSHDDLLCKHYPLKVLGLAIETGNEQCAMAILTNKRVVHHLQPGSAVRLNLNMRWEQRRDSVKRLFNIYTCVGTAIRCGLCSIIQAIYKLNPSETRQAVWYALYMARGRQAEVSFEIREMANRYRLDKLWPQIRVILMLRDWERRRKKRIHVWERMARFCRGHQDWGAVASHPWAAALPDEMLLHVLSFLVPSKVSEANRVTMLVEY